MFSKVPTSNTVDISTSLIGFNAAERVIFEMPIAIPTIQKTGIRIGETRWKNESPGRPILGGTGR